MVTYKTIDIFTSEAVRYHRKSVDEAVLGLFRDMKIAARCMVTRGTDGCYESGEMVTRRLEVLAFNLPVHIQIILPEAELDRVLPLLTDMVADGIVALSDLQVVSHRVHNAFFPRQLKVRDAMTPAPQSVTVGDGLDLAATLLLSSIFTGLPVVDGTARPIGVITQGDLMSRGGLPLRLGLLAETDSAGREAVLSRLAAKKVSEAMTTPAVTIVQDKLLTEAVTLMLDKGLKRLPVVDEHGVLVGILSRLDIFRTAMQQAPDWNAFQANKIEVLPLRCVGDIMRRDAYAVAPDTSIGEVMVMIDRNDIQCVAVVDTQDKLLGVISDRDLLRYFNPRQEGVWGLFDKIKHALTARSGPGSSELHQSLTQTSAAEVMTTDPVTVTEAMRVDEAIERMISKSLKRLPVVDGDGRFKGMISRDSLLRIGFQGQPDRS